MWNLRGEMSEEDYYNLILKSIKIELLFLITTAHFL